MQHANERLVQRPLNSVQKWSSSLPWKAGLAANVAANVAADSAANLTAGMTFCVTPGVTSSRRSGTARSII